MDHPDRLTRGAVRRLVRLMVSALLVVGALALVTLCNPAHAVGQAGGTFVDQTCVSTTNIGAPGFDGCGQNIGTLREADRTWKINDMNAQSATYIYTFKAWTTCDPLATSGTCSFSISRTNKITGNAATDTAASLGYTARTVSTQQCPENDPNYVKVGANCYCAPGRSPQPDGTCGVNNCPKAGTVISGTADSMYPAAGPVQNFMGCWDGCLVSGAYSGSTGTGPDAQNWIAGPLVHIGQICNPSTQGGTTPGLGSPKSDPAGPPAPKCPPPKCPGTVNGTQVCVACTTTTTGQVTKPDGAQDSGGTITKTECTGGVCTTTTTTVDGQGNVVSGGTTTTGTGGANPNANGTGTGTGEGDGESMSDFCESNPNSLMCSEDGESNFSGSCTGNFACDGDAIQCAIAKEQHDRNCQMFDDATPLSDKGNQAVTGGDRPDGHPGNDAAETPLDFSSSIDRTNLIGGSCPAGQSLTVNGTTVTLLTPGMCDMLGMLGNLIVAVGALASAFIVFRG